MRKILFILVFFLLANSIFAKNTDISVIPIKTDYNEIQTENNKTQQTVISDSGIEVTVDAQIIDKNLQYNLVLKNLKNKNFKVKQDCIKTYYGNFDKDEWTENDSTTFKLPEEKKDSNNSNKQSSDDTLNYCIMMGATCVCGLTLLNICNSTSKSSDRVRSSKSSSTRRVEPRNTRPSTNTRRSGGSDFVWLFIDTPSRGPSININIDTDIVINNPDSSYNSSINDVFKGSFLVPLENSPDYKLRFIVSENEYIDFYFSRSDRDSMINPLKDKNYARHSITFDFNKSFNQFGASYILSTKSLGLYLGGAFKLDYFGSDCGTFYNDNLNDCYVNDHVPYPSNYSYFEDYRYQLKPNGTIFNNQFNLDFGLTLKLFSNTWLMAGCDVRFRECYYQGGIYWKYSYENASAFDDPDRFLTTGCMLKDETDISFSPEIGLNFIFDHLDLGFKLIYSIENKDFDLRFMAGFAI